MTEERKGAGTTGRPWGRGVRWYLEAEDGGRSVPTIPALVPPPEVSLNSERNPANRGRVRPEDHVKLARFALRGLTRPEDEEDDVAAAALVLVQAAQAWNAGKVTCAWSTYLVSRVRWEWIRTHFNRGKPRRLPTIPLFLSAPDDEEAEIERPEMAVEDPELREAEARADVEALLEGLTAGEALVLRRRFGIGGTEPLTHKAVGEELGVGRDRIRTIEAKALARLRRRVRPRTYTIPLDRAEFQRIR